MSEADTTKGENVNQGWQCPNCGRCYAPWVYACGSCDPSTVTTTSTLRISAHGCTCSKRPWGLEPTSAPCPVHGSSLNDRTTTVMT